MVWLGVALLGGFGACARFLLDGSVAGRTGRAFPYGTLAVNLSGAFILGLLSGAGVAGDEYLLTGTAIIGSYTTFSTWMLETQRPVEDGRPRTALANIVVSLVLGFGFVLLGRTIGRWL